MEILKGVDVLAGAGNDSNSYIIDGQLLVDSGSGEWFARAKEYIAGRYDTSRLKTIVVTHSHYNHAGGAKKFRDWLKATVCVHEKEAEWLETGNGTCAEMSGAVARSMTADKRLREGIGIKTDNFTFRVIHTPGHSPGSLCLFDEESGMLISGDTVFWQRARGTDMPSGSDTEMQESLKKLAQLQIKHLLPGHGMPKTGSINFYIKQLLAQNRSNKI